MVDIYCNVVVMDIVLYLIIILGFFVIVSYWFFRFCFWFECFGWSYYRDYFFLVGCIIILIDIFFSFIGFVISCNVYGFFFFLIKIIDVFDIKFFSFILKWF